MGWCLRVSLAFIVCFIPEETRSSVPNSPRAYGSESTSQGVTLTIFWRGGLI